MITPSKYPEHGYLVEWNEKQQAFFINQVRNRKPEKQTNVHGVVPVAVCANWREAHLVIEFVESLLVTRGALAYNTKATTRQVQLFIKKLVSFSEKRVRIIKKSSKDG